MTVEEELVPATVVVALTASGVAEECRRVSTEQPGTDLKLLAADVNADPSSTALARANPGQQWVIAARAHKVQTIET